VNSTLSGVVRGETSVNDRAAPAGSPDEPDAPETTAVRGAVVGLATSALIVAGITVLARLVGFGRIFVYSGQVGAGCAGTAYAAANQVPNVLFEATAGGALAGCVVPVVAGLMGRGLRQDADRAASALLTWTLLILLPVSGLVALLSGPISALLMGGRSGEDSCPGAQDLSSTMLLVFAPQVVLYGVGIVLAGILQAHRRFSWPAAVPLLSSGVVIASYLWYGLLAGQKAAVASWVPDRTTELVLSVGTTLGVVALSLPLLVPVLSSGIRLRPTLHFPAGTATRARSLAGAGLTTLVAQQISVVATLLLATRVGGRGVINVVQYAQAVYLLPYAVLAVPLATVAFPRLSAQMARGDTAAFAGTLTAATRAVVVVSSAGTAALLACAGGIHQLFAQLDVVGGDGLEGLDGTVTLFAPGLLGWSLVALLGKALAAADRNRQSATAISAGWGAAVLASLASVSILQHSFGYGPARAAAWGVALGNTVGMSVAGCALLFLARSVAGPGALAGTSRTLMACALGAVAGGSSGRWLQTTWEAGGVLRAAGESLCAAGLGGVVFLAVLLLADPGSFTALTAFVGRRTALRRRRSGVPGIQDGELADGDPADAPSAQRDPAARSEDRGPGEDGSQGERPDLIGVGQGPGARFLWRPGIGDRLGSSWWAGIPWWAGDPGRSGSAASGSVPVGETAQAGAGDPDTEILLVMATSSGGVGRHVAELAEGLAARGTRVRVAGPAATAERFGLGTGRAGFVAVSIADRPRPLADLRAVARLRSLTGPRTVVHAHGLRAGALATLAVRGRPHRPRIMVTLHNALVSGGPVAAVHRILERIVARGADVVLVVSGDLGDRMRDLGAHRVDRALVPAPGRPAPTRTPEAVRRDLGVPPGTALLVCVARLAPQKGLNLLVDAVEQLSGSAGGGRAPVAPRPVLAVVAGDGPLHAGLDRDIAARQVPVRLLGNRQDVPDLLAAADVVVVPSVWEGQPLIVQEALRAGAAIVATDVGGTAEVAGNGAVLVPGGDPQALARALADLLGESAPVEDLRRRALSCAAGLPRAEDAVRQVRALCTELARQACERRTED
jgi:putative peptidoglycan lipid II flippase